MQYRWILILIALVVTDLFLFRLWTKWQRERRFDRQISVAARKYQIEPALVKAVVWQESKFAESARGSAGEIGLMQLRKPAAEEWAETERLAVFSHEHLFDPASNVLAGTWYLSKLLKRYIHTDNPLAYALADYNAGRTHVLRWMQGAGRTNSEVFISQIDFPGTRHYVRSVLDRSRRYRKDFNFGL